MVLERHRDSKALIEHAAHRGDVTPAVIATDSVAGELLGQPSAALRANGADGPVRLFSALPVDGHTAPMLRRDCSEASPRSAPKRTVHGNVAESPSSNADRNLPQLRRRPRCLETSHAC